MFRENREIANYLDKMETIQSKIIKLIDACDKDSQEIKYQKLLILLEKLQIQENKYEFSSFLHLLTIIYNNHHHQLDFIDMIEKIIKYYEFDIKKFYNNSEIFTIFKENKRILLFLIESKLMIIDDYVLMKMQNEKYCYYFYPEIKMFLDNESIERISTKLNDDILDNFEYKRKIGENESYICHLIRNDSIDNFIEYINRCNISFSKKIDFSIFETNRYLLKKKNVNLIEYATFFGSIRIFKYMLLNNASLEPSLWMYAIHGNNPEIFHILEQYNISPKDITFIKCYDESIKCHHNDIADYLQSNFLFHNLKENSESLSDMVNSLRKEAYDPMHCYLKYYNFKYIKTPHIITHLSHKMTFYYDLCRYDYSEIVKVLLKTNSKIFNVKFLKTSKI